MKLRMSSATHRELDRAGELQPVWGKAAPVIVGWRLGPFEVAIDDSLEKGRIEHEGTDEARTASVRSS